MNFLMHFPQIFYEERKITKKWSLFNIFHSFVYQNTNRFIELKNNHFLWCNSSGLRTLLSISSHCFCLLSLFLSFFLVLSIPVLSLRNEPASCVSVFLFSFSFFSVWTVFSFRASQSFHRLSAR